MVVTDRRFWTPLHNERVMRDIIGRGLLTRQEIRVCTFIWRESWGRRRQTTHPDFPITTAALVEWTALSSRCVQRAVQILKERRALAIHEDGAWEFNEHIDTWIEPNRLLKDRKYDGTRRTRKAQTTEPDATEPDAKGDGTRRQKRRNLTPKTTEPDAPHIIPPDNKTTRPPEKTAETTEPDAPNNGQFSQVYQTLRAIDAKVYRDLEPTAQFEAILKSESDRLGGVGAVVAHAQRFAVWIEDQFQNGAEKREKRHRPRHRFAVWLAREKPTGGTSRLEAEYRATLQE